MSPRSELYILCMGIMAILLPPRVMDESVDIHQVRRFFTFDAWMVIEDRLKRKRERAIWTCKSCCHDLGEEQSIIVNHA